MSGELKHYKSVVEYIKRNQNLISAVNQMDAKICILEENDQKVYVKKEIKNESKS